MSDPASGRVFISYRRQESSGLAGRLYDRLADRFGDDQVFMDVDTIALGVDFAEVITQAVSTCQGHCCIESEGVGEGQRSGGSPYGEAAKND